MAAASSVEAAAILWMVKEKNVRRNIHGIIKASNLCMSNVQ